MNLIDLRFLMVLALLPALYWLLPRSRRLVALSLLSCAAIAWFSPLSALALVTISAGTYRACLSRPPTARLISGGIAALVLILAAYKSLALFRSSGPSADPGGLGSIMLIGLAFYALKAIQVLVDRYRHPGLAPVPADLFFAYMLFFPTVLVGPIHGLAQFQADWRQQAFSARRVSSALERLLWGYAKLILLGGYLVNFKLVHAIEDVPADMLRLHEYLENLRYGLHLYLTFAGASDIAIAFAALLGFRINENFNHPFTATSIAEFWRRWHMSLSHWARHYLYAPLVAMTRNHTATLILTMGLIGAWHELSVRYLVWGAYHGLGLVVHHRWVAGTDRFEWMKAAKAHFLYRALAMCLTFHFVMLGFGIARAQTNAHILGQFRVLVLGSP